MSRCHLVGRIMRLNAILVGMATVSACAPADQSTPRTDRGREPVSASLAIGVGDPVVGRALLPDRVLLLTQSRQLVELWPVSGVTKRTPVLGLDPLDRLRGLARLDDGTLWTLVGREEVVEILDGRAARRLRLPGFAVALYGAGDRLVYQPVDFDPPAPALVAMRPEDPARLAWGPLRTRMFGRSRTEGMMFNLVVCGLGTDGLIPCWFPVGDHVAVVDAAGDGRLIRLAGVRTIAPDDLLNRDVSARPLRDVFARALGDVWVLGADVLDRPGRDAAPDWQLVRFDEAGQVRQVRSLEAACRAFLAMTDESAWLLANDGSILRVEL